MRPGREDRQAAGLQISAEPSVARDRQRRAVQAADVAADAAIAQEPARPIVPLCPFVKAYIERNPEYAAMVDIPGTGRDGRDDA